MNEFSQTNKRQMVSKFIQFQLHEQETGIKENNKRKQEEKLLKSFFLFRGRGVRCKSSGKFKKMRPIESEGIKRSSDTLIKKLLSFHIFDEKIFMKQKNVWFDERENMRDTQTYFFPL